MRIEAIQVPYVKDLSVNHYLGRRKGSGYYVKPSVVRWKEEFGWLLKKLELDTWELPLSITCNATFKDGRSACDLSNLSKVICDTIQSVSGIDDKNFRWHDGKRDIIRGCDPYLLIVVKELNDESS